MERDSTSWQAPSGQPRGWAWLVLGVLVLVVLKVGFGDGVDRDGTLAVERDERREPQTLLEAAPVVGGTWTEAPPAPPYWSTVPVGVWTGREMLFLGPGDGGMVAGAYDPARLRWRELARPPLSDRIASVVQWLPTSATAPSDGELVVWGGRTRGRGAWAADGAAYDPAADSWRPLTGPLAGRAAAVSTAVPSGLLVMGGFAADGSPLRDGAVLLAGGDEWESVPDVPGAPSPIAALVSSGRQAIVVLAPSQPAGEAKVYGWQRGNQGWREYPPVSVERATMLAVAASGDTVAVWPDAGAADRGVLHLLDTRTRQWGSVTAPIASSGPPHVTWVDERLALWSSGDSGDHFTEGVLYDPRSRRWERLDGFSSGLWWPVPPFWVGNQLLKLDGLTAWRPEGALPSLAEDVDAAVHLTTTGRLYSIDVDARSMRWRRIMTTSPPQYPSELMLLDGHFIAPRWSGGVQAIPDDGGPPIALDAMRFLPAGGDAVWLLRSGPPWTAVRARGDGTKLEEPMPLPDGSAPVAGLADSIVVADDDGVRHWDPAAQISRWQLPHSTWVVAGADVAASCSDRDCNRLDVRGSTADPKGSPTVDGGMFSQLPAAFTPDDRALAIEATSEDGPGIAIITQLNGEPEVAHVAELNGPPSSVAWHPGGDWLFAAVNQRLVAVDATSGQVYDAGMDVPEGVNGMVATASKP